MLNHFTEFLIDATLRTFADGSRTKGKWTPGAASDTAIKIIALQPLRSNDLNMLPDGEIASDWRLTWVDEAYDIQTRVGAKDAKQIIVGGKTYKVMKVDDRTEIGNFRKVFLRDIAGE